MEVWNKYIQYIHLTISRVLLNTGFAFVLQLPVAF
jgi:hypothetical protein